MIDTETTSRTSSVLSPSENINLEISFYLDIPTLEMDADPTSVPSERMFSLSCHICNNSRNCLLPENVNKLVFLARNM